jgi:hypothetical protein
MIVYNAWDAILDAERGQSDDKTNAQYGDG